MKAPLCFTPVEFIHNSAWDAPAASVFTEEDGAVMLRVRANLFSLWNSVPPPPDPRTRALCHLSATPPLPPHAPLTSVWSDVRYQAMSQGALPISAPQIAIHTSEIFGMICVLVMVVCSLTHTLSFAASLQMDAVVRGDVLLLCRQAPSGDLIFRYSFHTTFVVNSRVRDRTLCTLLHPPCPA